MEVYETLCNPDSFNYKPWEVDELTDFQIWELLLGPAVRRSKERERQDPDREYEPGQPKRLGVPNRRTRLPTRDEFIAIGGVLKGDAERLGREYDEWAASESGQKALAKQKRKRK